MKRFYKNAVAKKGPEGFQILLDGRPVRTPAGHVLLLPTAALADAVAQEWQSQGEDIMPATMPMLRLANTAQDGVGAHRADVAAAILRFGDHDLLCYRAHDAPELLRRQREAWDPLLSWAADQMGARLKVTEGITHVDQPPEALAALARAVDAETDHGLAALHVMASITGSLVLGLALANGALNPSQAFQLSRLDEIFQAERWGEDAEAQQRISALARELDVAARFRALAGD